MSEREPGLIRRNLPRIAVGGLTVLGLATLYNKAEDALDWLPDIDIPGFSANIGNHPPEAEAAVKRDTYRVEEHDLGINCEARLSVGIGTTGNKDELIGGGRFNDVVFADAIYCGKDPFRGEQSVEGAIELTKNERTGEVTKVVIRSTGLQAHHPRINFFDFRQCVKLDADATAEEIESEIQEWVEDAKERIEDDKHPKCDVGFDVTGAGGGSDLANVIPASYAAAQLALAVDQEPRDELAEMNETFFADLVNEAKVRFPGAAIEVEQLDNKEAAERQLQEIKAELKRNYYEVEEEREDGRIQLYVRGPGGVKVKVPDISYIKSEPVEVTGLSTIDPLEAEVTSNWGWRGRRG